MPQPKVIDPDTGEIDPPAKQTAPVEPEQPKPRPEYAYDALATDGEKKLIINRARNAGLDILDLIDNAGLQGLAPDLSGLTKDGFLALKDSLPKAA